MLSPPFASAPVLDFRPQGSESSGAGYRWKISLLWPAWEYRVLAPAPRETTVNLFERAALGLCRAGVIGAPEVAALLGFDVELAARVLHDLRLKQLVDEFGVPTEKGRDTLNDLDVVNDSSYHVSYLYRDPHSGFLFPRVIPAQDRNRALAAVEVNDKGHIAMLTGSVGKRKSVRAFAVPPESLAVLAPTPDEVLDASILHGRARKSRRKASGTDDDAEEQTVTLSEAEAEKRQLEVKRVDLIDDAPRPVWLYTYASQASGSSGTDSWTVCDPFGIGDSPALLRRVRDRAASFPALKKRIDDKTGKSSLDDLKKDRLRDEVRAREAAQAVADALGTDVPESVGSHLRWMEAHLAAGQVGAAYHLRSALAEAQSAAEALFQVLLRGSDARAVSAALEAVSGRGRISLLNQIAQEVGFSTPLPNKTSGQSPNRQTCRGQKGSLRGYVAAAICASGLSIGHPLRTAAKTEPDLIAVLDDIAEVRNAKGGHAGSDAPTVAEARAVADCAYRACTVLLPLL